MASSGSRRPRPHRHPRRARRCSRRRPPRLPRRHRPACPHRPPRRRRAPPRRSTPTPIPSPAADITAAERCQNPAAGHSRADDRRHRRGARSSRHARVDRDRRRQRGAGRSRRVGAGSACPRYAAGGGRQARGAVWPAGDPTDRGRCPRPRDGRTPDAEVAQRGCPRGSRRRPPRDRDRSTRRETDEIQPPGTSA